MKTIRVRYACPKCGNHEFELGSLFAPGSRFATFFNIEHRRFSTITCSKCFYTELYKLPKEKIQANLDLFVTK